MCLSCYHHSSNAVCPLWFLTKHSQQLTHISHQTWSKCCKTQLYVQVLVSKFLVQISCIMTKYGDPHKEYLRKIIRFKFLNVWKVSKVLEMNFASFNLLMDYPIQLSYLLFTKLIFSKQIFVFIEELLHWDKTLSCQAN